MPTELIYADQVPASLESRDLVSYANARSAPSADSIRVTLKARRN